MFEDRFGLPLSTTNAEARDAYIAGVDSVISGVAGYRESLAQALAFDPSSRWRTWRSRAACFWMRR